MKLNIAATKTNFLKVKKSLALTREGHELLDEKRKILIHELNALVNVTDRLEKDAGTKLRQAYEVADKAVIAMGGRNVSALSLSMDIKNDISIAQRRIVGVDVPTIELKIIDKPPYHSPHDISFYADETILKFKEVLKLLAELAEKKIALLRIAAEAFKTIRKVNALEKIYIPDYEDTFKYISERLDEEGRESFLTLKMIKSRLKG
jgi:V/A-type H+-transporting ATPase subunit D